MKADIEVEKDLRNAGVEYAEFTQRFEESETKKERGGPE
jgi:hypothetical protein